MSSESIKSSDLGMPDLGDEDLTQLIRSAGIVGAGGAGFPTYVKWSNLGELEYLLVNLQESEPIFYSDKYLAKKHADSFTKFFEWLLENYFEKIVIGSKTKYREKWTEKLEKNTQGKVYLHDDLPIDLDNENKIIFSYTHDVFDFSRDFALLRLISGKKIYPDLPVEHGWITNNAETIFNIYKAVFENEPVTEKYVHVDGNTPMHRCIKAPIGTPAKDLIKAAGVDPEALKKDQILLEGGPGWCSKLNYDPDKFGLSKRTNGLLVMNKKSMKERLSNSKEKRINLLNERDWKRKTHEEEPEDINPDYVKIPLLSNLNYRGKVQSSQPIVSPGEKVEKGQVIAIPNSNGISIPQHSSIDGKVRNITTNHIVINQL